MITALFVAAALACAEPKIINESNEPWGTELDLKSFKRAQYVCRERYKGCISRMFKRTPRDYAVLCRRDQVGDKFASERSR